MIKAMHKIFNLHKFFNIISLEETVVEYKLLKPCGILLQNIQTSWLQSLHSKTQMHFPVYLSKNYIQRKRPPYGYINSSPLQYHVVYEHNLNDYAPDIKSGLEFNIVVPLSEMMPYFIKWQRYRKYWWSSITTTPSLFGIDDINYSDDKANANIVAKFPWGQQTVETIHISSSAKKDLPSISCLTCKTSLEEALFILLLDAITNTTKEQYLRLHRMMAPFKISFALNYKDDCNKQRLNDLAALLHHNLEMKSISSLLPDFKLPLGTQLKENMKIGVVNTAILSENTLVNGIFQLMNSSTMLKEEVHVADFISYAALMNGSSLTSITRHETPSING